MDDIVIPQALIWLVIGIGVFVQFLREFAGLEPYKRFIPYLTIGIGIGGAYFGGTGFPGCVEIGVAIGLMAAGGYDAIKAFQRQTPTAETRGNALPSIPLDSIPPMPAVKGPSLNALTIPLCAALLLLGGCAGPLFSAQQRLRVQQAAAIVGELDTRCQAGDEAACREGLSRAAETLAILAADGEQ